MANRMLMLFPLNIYGFKISYFDSVASVVKHQFELSIYECLGFRELAASLFQLAFVTQNLLFFIDGQCEEF
jgi:hypothetical protein